MKPGREKKNNLLKKPRSTPAYPLAGDLEFRANQLCNLFQEPSMTEWITSQENTLQSKQEFTREL